MDHAAEDRLKRAEYTCKCPATEILEEKAEQADACLKNNDEAVVIIAT